MSISKLPDGRWRAQVWHEGRNVAVAKVLGPEYTSFATKREARAAREEARAKLSRPRGGVTVAEFRERWLTDRLFARPKDSTMVHNRERTKPFVERYGEVPIREVGDEIVAEWLAGGNRAGTVPALRAMFNDAMSAKAGRLVERNPFARLGLRRSAGNRYVDPPSEETVWQLIRAAREVSTPSFAAWLQVAAFTGMRPGELDALRWERVDWDAGEIDVVEQFNHTSKTFTTPKNGKARRAPLTPPAREALLGLAKEAEFCFVTLRRTHWSESARAYHWKAVRASVGFTDSLYLATRHFAGSYMVNVLELPSEDVAIALGHEDGGELVRMLYGHRDKALALDRVKAAYDRRGNVRPLRVVREDGA